MTQFELSDEDVLKIDKFLSNEAIKERAVFLRKRAVFTDQYKNKDSNFLFEIIELAKKNGIMGYSFRSGTCAICGSGKNYIKFKSGMRKGEINHNKTWYSTVLDYRKSFVRVKDYTPFGVCEECRENGFDDLLKRTLLTGDFKFEWNDKIVPCPYEKDEKKICFKCEKSMWESEMSRSQKMFASHSTYASTCPHCGAVAMPFGASHDITEDFRIIEKK
ncbi:MAG: hypothetical protein KAS66_04055 [Candidatus Omnitrophica bacterium]|nr:hypothetical protein [Candidatus Omnitrophota bacterium]